MDFQTRWCGLCWAVVSQPCVILFLSVYLITLKKITSSDLIRKEEMLSQCLEHKLKEGQVLYSLVTFQLSQIIRPGMLSKVTGSIQSFKGNPTFPAFGAATWSWMMKTYVTLALFFLYWLYFYTSQPISISQLLQSHFFCITTTLLLHPERESCSTRRTSTPITVQAALLHIVLLAALTGGQ